jgi:hypothetical protein
MSIQGNSRGPLGSAIGVNLNAVGDTFIKLPVGQYIPRNITITNASTTLAASAAQLAVYTGAAATGTAISAAAVATTLTGPTVFADRTIAAATTVFTPTYDATQKAYGVYVRVTVVHGSAATLDLHIFGDAVK